MRLEPAGARDRARDRPGDASAQCGITGIAAEHRQRAAIGRGQTGQQRHGRRLAGAVRSEQAENFAGANVEAQLVERDRAAELLANLIDANHAHSMPRPQVRRQ